VLLVRVSPEHRMVICFRRSKRSSFSYVSTPAAALRLEQLDHHPSGMMTPVSLADRPQRGQELGCSGELLPR